MALALVHNKVPSRTRRKSLTLRMNDSRYFPETMGHLLALIQMKENATFQFGFYNITNCYRKPKLAKNFTFHGVLLSYQPTSTADPAQVGQISCADWLVAQKDIVQCEFSSWFWLSMTNSVNMKAKLERSHFSFFWNWSCTECHNVRNSRFMNHVI